MPFLSRVFHRACTSLPEQGGAAEKLYNKGRCRATTGHIWERAILTGACTCLRYSSQMLSLCFPYPSPTTLSILSIIIKNQHGFTPPSPTTRATTDNKICCPDQQGFPSTNHDVLRSTPWTEQNEDKVSYLVPQVSVQCRALSTHLTYFCPAGSSPRLHRETPGHQKWTPWAGRCGSLHFNFACCFLSLTPPLAAHRQSVHLADHVDKLPVIFFFSAMGSIQG